MKIEINLKIILLGILFFVLKRIDIYVIFIFFITLHEIAHLVIGMMLGLKPSNFVINPLGVSIEFYSFNGRKNYKKVITFLAGPLANLIFAIIFLFVQMEENLKLKIIYTNFLLAIFNLIPIIPLDGGKILKELLLKKVGNKEASIFMNNLTQAVLVIITFVYSLAILKIQNFALFLLIVYMWYLKYVEDKKLKIMLKAYEIVEKS